MSHGGKGSGRRPAEVSTQTVSDNWDRIFGKKEEPKHKRGETPVSAHIDELAFIPTDDKCIGHLRSIPESTNA